MSNTASILFGIALILFFVGVPIAFMVSLFADWSGWVRLALAVGSGVVLAIAAISQVMPRW